MNIQDIFTKLKQFDNQQLKWQVKNFYAIMYEIPLIIVLIFFFFNMMNVIVLSQSIAPNDFEGQLLIVQNINGLLIVILLFFIAFFTLLMLKTMLRSQGIIKNIEYNINRRK